MDVNMGECERGFRCVIVSRRAKPLKHYIIRFSRRLFGVPDPAPKIAVYCELNGQVIAGVEMNKLNFFRICVSPGFRGKGIGTCLLKKLVKLAKEMGLNFIILTVNLNRKSALRLYHKFRFMPCLLIKARGGSMMVMVLPLRRFGVCLYRLLCLLGRLFRSEGISRMALSIYDLRFWYSVW